MFADLLIGLYNWIRKWAKNYGMKTVKRRDKCFQLISWIATTTTMTKDGNKSPLGRRELRAAAAKCSFEYCKLKFIIIAFCLAHTKRKKRKNAHHIHRPTNRRFRSRGITFRRKFVAVVIERHFAVTATWRKQNETKTKKSFGDCIWTRRERTGDRSHNKYRKQ